MKLHVGHGPTRDRAHRVGRPHAGAADITQLPDLLHGQESEVFGDQAYWKEVDRQAFEERGVRYQMNRRPNGREPLSDRWSTSTEPPRKSVRSVSIRSES